MTRALTPRFSPSPPRPEPGRTVTQREGKTPAAPSRHSTVLPTRGQPGGTCCSIPQISPPIPGTANPGRSAAPPGALGTGAAALSGRARGRVWGRIGPRAHPGGAQTSLHGPSQPNGAGVREHRGSPGPLSCHGAAPEPVPGPSGREREAPAPGGSPLPLLRPGAPGGSAEPGPSPGSAQLPPAAPPGDSR